MRWLNSNTEPEANFRAAVPVEGTAWAICLEGGHEPVLPRLFSRLLMAMHPCPAAVQPARASSWDQHRRLSKAHAAAGSSGAQD